MRNSNLASVIKLSNAKIMRLISLIFLVQIILGCSETRREDKKQEVKVREDKNYPFELINSKFETIGTNINKMDLYVPLGKLEVNKLKELSKDRKERWVEGAFYFLVVFDHQANAVFPNNPFTAQYGIDEEPQTHIRAIFEYNRVNGYSKLTYYTTNMWEGAPTTIDIK